jgi:chromosome segregation ATPase
MDMNESEVKSVDTGISINKLLEIIGKQSVEWIVNEEAVKNFKEQYIAVVKQLATANAELTALKTNKPIVSPEIEQLKKADVANGERIKQLENQVHNVAVERDNAQKRYDEAVKNVQILTKTVDTEHEKYETLLVNSHALRDRIEELETKAKKVKK